jgi:hypothetical protein
MDISYTIYCSKKGMKNHRNHRVLNLQPKVYWYRDLTTGLYDENDVSMAIFLTYKTIIFGIIQELFIQIKKKKTRGPWATSLT